MMDEKLQQHITFHLTGRRDGAVLQTLTANHRPALFARYADLTALRYDFPLILNSEGAQERAVLSLSRLVDKVVDSLADDPSRDRIARHGYMIEREIRVRLRESGGGDLAAIWNSCVERLSAEDETIRFSADRLWAEFFAAGQIVDVGRKLPRALLVHIWQAEQRQKARAFREKAERLSFKVHKILDAEFEGSQAGRSPERLKASVGASFSQSFDFNALSTFVNESKQGTRLSDERRKRIDALIEVVENQRFFTSGVNASPAYDFVFDNCRDALDAYTSRLEEATLLLKAIAVAELDANGEYRDATHDAIFESFGSGGLDADQLSELPDYLVTLNTATLNADERARIADLLSSGLPFKFLLQIDDILEPSESDGKIGLGSVTRQLTSAAIGMTDVYVLQASASDLFKLSGQITRGMAYEGPALLSIFSGESGHSTDIPSYLNAAAAVESRAFPSFVFDPSAGTNWASRFSVDNNPSVDLDWPRYDLAYEDDTVQARSETIEFTLGDFMAMDDRFRSRFALVPESDWHDQMTSLSEAIAAEESGMPDAVPAVWLIDDQFRLRRAISDVRMVRDARSCLSVWHSLQELGGINNSFVVKLLELGYKPALDAPSVAADELKTAETIDVATPDFETVSAAPMAANTDEPYIETDRCTTCNECTQINTKMFAYNADRQAYIADPDAGTFRQLVEAAEGCQVSIIHPGKPRNPKEPGLEDLIKRAEPFA